MTAATLPATDDDDGWVRLHPLTPFLRGGRFAFLLLAIIGQRTLSQSPAPGRTAAVLFGVGVPVVVLGGYIAWRAMRYRLTDTELQVESGVITKRSRRVPLARLQAVDVVRPFYARVLGLAELRLEVVGGGGGAEAPLAFLSDDDANRLRAQLLDLAAGRRNEARAVEGPVAPEVPERVLVVVPTGTLIWSNLLGAPLVTVVVLLVALVVAGLTSLEAVGGVLFFSVPVLLGVLSLVVRRFLSEYGFTVAESVDGLRLRHGLLDTRSQTIPAGRIQVIRVLEPVLWRPFGWVRVEVDVAGYSGGGEEQAATGALLPVAPRDLADRLVARLLDANLPEPAARAPRAARLRAPLAHRRLGVGLDDRHLVSTYGIVTTTTDVVPLTKVQSARLTQGPLQRRLGLTTLHVDTAGRRLPGAIALHRDADEAPQLLAEVSRRAAALRGAAAP